MNTRILLLGSLCASALLGCDRLCGEGSPANVAGGWQLSGEATCLDDEGLHTSVDFSGGMNLPITQSANGSDLALAAPVTVEGGTFRFTGKVNGSCADFTIEESGPGYTASYTFKGVVQGTTIEGDVSGTGTGVCPFEGDFKVSVFGELDMQPGTSTTSTTAAECSIATDCGTGEKCISGRCEIAEGCNCNSSEDPASSSWAWLSLLAIVLPMLLRLMRSSSRISKAKSANPASPASPPG